MDATKPKPTRRFTYRARDPNLLRNRVKHYGYKTRGRENQWLFGDNARFEPTTAWRKGARR